MTRTEFDKQVREMKVQRAQAQLNVKTMQQDLMERIAAKNRAIFDLTAEVKKMKHQLTLLNIERDQINTKWNEKINAFIAEFESHTTSNLAEAETVNIVYELRRRGFYGMVQRLGEDPNDYETYDLTKTDWKQDDNED